MNIFVLGKVQTEAPKETLKMSQQHPQQQQPQHQQQFLQQQFLQSVDLSGLGPVPDFETVASLVASQPATDSQPLDSFESWLNSNALTR